jgi:hypothetical protein
MIEFLLLIFILSSEKTFSVSDKLLESIIDVFIFVTQDTKYHKTIFFKSLVSYLDCKIFKEELILSR